MISVVIPVYNTAPYLRTCLNSVCEQSYTDLQIILVDDGSKDKSGEICDEFREKDDRVLVIHQENQGVSAARNHALQFVKGEWVSFIDSDDWLEKDMYESLLSLASRTNADIAEANVYEEQNNKCIRRNIWDSLGKEYVCFTGTEKYLYGYSYTPVLWNKLIKRELIKEKFSENIRYGEDTLFLLGTVIAASVIAVTTKPLYHYRIIRDGNVVSSVLDDRILDLICSYEMITAKLREYCEFEAAGHIAYIAVLTVISKTSTRSIIKNRSYLNSVQKLARQNRKCFRLLKNNLRTSSWRRLLVELSVWSPVLSVSLWNISTAMKQWRLLLYKS